jgi:electron transfer flavoprotein beta subunit
VDRELENNEVQVVDITLPAVVTVQTGMNTPRYASLKGIMAAKKKPVATLALSDLGLGPEDVGAKLRTVSLAPPPKGKSAEILTGSPEEIAKALVGRIREKTGVL